MERKTEVQMENSLAGVDNAVSMCVRRKFVSVKGFGRVKVQRHSFVISELDGWRVVSYRLEKPPTPHPPPPGFKSIVGRPFPRSYLNGYGSR